MRTTTFRIGLARDRDTGEIHFRYEREDWKSVRAVTVYQLDLIALDLEVLEQYDQAMAVREFAELCRVTPLGEKISIPRINPLSVIGEHETIRDWMQDSTSEQ